MIDILTVNQLDNFRSVKGENDNYLICHSYTSDLLVASVSNQVQHFTIYYKDGMDSSELEDMQEQYASDNKLKFRFVSTSYMSEALDKIRNKISNRIDPDEDQDVQVICAMDEKVATRIMSYLNRSFRENLVDCEAVSLLRHSKIPDMASLTETFKKMFHTDFIYPDDPVQFAYVCRAYIEGRVR